MKGHLTVAQWLARSVRNLEMSHVFLVPTVLSRTLVELESLAVRRVVTHGEKAAVYMADGFARASRKPTLAMAQAVGAMYMAAGLQDPYLAGSPLIAIAGGPSPSSMARRQY